MICKAINEIKENIPNDVTLVAVSKTKPIADVVEAYACGQRIFGENKVQELVEKHAALPKDIAWHMIGHLQRNKVKYIAPFVTLIHGVDSERLLKEINKQAAKYNRVVDVLLQMHVAEESTKFGMEQKEILELVAKKDEYSNVNIKGLMGMATFTADKDQVQREFKQLNTVFTLLQKDSKMITTLSMGMSGDYKIAIASGSTMIRVGSTIFGGRN